MRFDLPVRHGGYAWWYIDAISDDGAHALTLIAFVGSVFSPYYALANARAPAAAENFCAMNLALYGQHKRWAMTERGRRALSRGADFLAIGPSSLRWQDGTLKAEIAETTVPVPRRLRGTIALTPIAMQEKTFSLDADARHRWRPVAPMARVQVTFTHPQMSWSGQAYFDMNEGDAPLAQDFISWHWSRTAGARAAVLYDVQRRDGTNLSLALRFGEDGVATPFAPPPRRDLPGTSWGVARQTRSDGPPRLIKTLENAPFYARSHISAEIDASNAEAIHESLDMNRFQAPWVRMLLPFRMPRWR